MEAEIGVMSPQAKGCKDCGNHQELGERPGTDSPSESPEGTSPADTLILASRTMKEYISVVLSTQSVVLCYS